MTRAAALCVPLALLASCGGGTEPAPSPQANGSPAASPSPSPEATAEGAALADRLEAELVIEDQPDWLVAAYGSVWVTRDEAAAVDRIDPETNEVVDTVEVGGHPCNGIAAAFGSLWVPSCEEQAVYRVDARTLEVTATIEVPVFLSTAGALPNELAAGPDAVWMVTRGEGAFDALARIDPRTDEVTDTIGLGHVGAGVAATAEAVWVTSPDDGVVVRVDPRSLEVEAEITGLAAPTLVVANEEAAWVLSGVDSERSGGDGSVSRIDPARNQVVATIPVDDRGSQAGDLAIGEGALWVRTQYTLLARIDPAKDAITDRIADQKGLGGVAPGFGSIWLSDFSFSRVWRVAI